MHGATIKIINSIWYSRSHKRLYTTPVESGLLSTGVVDSRFGERRYQMLCLCSCSSWGWACQGPKHVEDNNVTYMSLLNCALKLVEEIILYYDARSKEHQVSCVILLYFGWQKYRQSTVRGTSSVGLVYPRGSLSVFSGHLLNCHLIQELLTDDCALIGWLSSVLERLYIQ